MAKSTLGSLLIDIQMQTATLNKQIDGIGKRFNKMGSQITNVIAGVAIGTLTKDLIRSGFEYNTQLEVTQNSIAGLLVATSQLKDENGKIISQQELYNNAMSESTVILEKLREINSQTPMGLEETANIYKTMLPSMRNVGATQSELIELTKNLAVASGVAGLKTQQLLAGVDGLATGTVLANSELGRFLNALGLSNTELKKSSDVVGLLNDKLSLLKGEITMEQQLSTLNENWNAVLGSMTKNIWTESKEWIQSLSDFLSSFRQSMPDIVVYFKAVILRVSQMWRLFVATLNLKFEQFVDGIKSSLNWLNEIGVTSFEFKTNLGTAQADFDKASAGVKSLTQNMLDMYEAMPDISKTSNTVAKSAELTSASLKKMGTSAKNATKHIKKSSTDLKNIKTDYEKWTDSVETSLEGGMTNVFKSWMDGALDFKDVMGNVLKEIIAQMFQMLVVKQLIAGVSGSLGGMFANAHGNAFEGGKVQAFASGGVVSSPTLFPMAGASTGLMGEAGPEAIMPLQRVGGDLGVNVTQTPVNIVINNYGSEQVQVQQQDDNTYEVFIGKLASDITRGVGAFGTALESRYGMRKA